MIDTSAFKEFIVNVNTTSKLNELLADAAEAETTAFASTAKHFSHSIKGKVSDSFAQIVGKIESQHKLPQHQEERSKFFEGLKDYLQKLPRINLELAFNPTDKFINKMSRFLEGDAGNSPILDIKVKPNILAGTTIEKDGVYRDYSYATKLDQVLKQKYSGGDK